MPGWGLLWLTRYQGECIRVVVEELLKEFLESLKLGKS